MEWIDRNRGLLDYLIDIIGAIGTFGAVVVALYFGYRSLRPKPRLILDCGLQFSVSENQATASEPYLYYQVTNRSPVPVVISNFKIRFGFFKKNEVSLVPTAGSKHSDTLEKKLELGESATLAFPADVFRFYDAEWMQNIFSNSMRKIDYYSIQFGFVDSLQNHAWKRPRKLLDVLRGERKLSNGPTVIDKRTRDR